MLLSNEECSTQLLAEEFDVPPDAVLVLGTAELELTPLAVEVEATGMVLLLLLVVLLELVAMSIAVNVAAAAVAAAEVDEEELVAVPLLSPLTARDVVLLLVVHFAGVSKLLVLVRQVL